MTTLLHIVSVLPVGSTTVERSFSRMKLIKTRLRNRLGEERLEMLMLIGMEGPEELTDGMREAMIDRFKYSGGPKMRHVVL